MQFLTHLVPSIERLPERVVKLGQLDVRRLLPVRGKRLIGPWCFFDRFGPLEFGSEKPMDVAPHPHIGLQTVTWLLQGEAIHNDSLGNECLIRPGQLSLMTAGKGIAHTEETPKQNSGHLDGAQLWVALPSQSRNIDPLYQCTPQQPSAEHSGGMITTILGEFDGSISSGKQFSPGVGVEIVVHPGSRMELPLDPSYEYGIVMVQGEATVLDTVLKPDVLYYLGLNRQELDLSSREGARLLLIGGVPFQEKILMWWNFVASSSDELLAARTDWENHERFGDVPRYQGQRIPAPSFIGKPVSS